MNSKKERRDSRQVSTGKKLIHSTYFITQGGIIAALYIVLSLGAKALGISSGAIQVRFSEALCILPVFTPAAIPGVTIGCFLFNLIDQGAPLDMIFGTLATLIGAFGTYFLRKKHWLAALPPILSNTFIIPWVLQAAYGLTDSYWYLMLTIFVGELISVGLLGEMLYYSMVNSKMTQVFRK